MESQAKKFPDRGSMDKTISNPEIIAALHLPNQIGCSNEDKEGIVSIPIQADSRQPKRFFIHLIWVVPLAVIIVLVLLVAVYYGLGIMFTHQIETLYTEKNCNGVVERAESMEHFYPVKVAPFANEPREQASECKAYLKADSLYKSKNWKAAYAAYLNYQTAHPNGIYILESKNFSADALFEIASEQRNQHDFSSAVDSLKLLVEKFNNTPAVSKTRAAIPEVYLEWGRECRSGEEFIEAEVVYLSLVTWAAEQEEEIYAERAKAELAHTYFDWGIYLEAQNEFEEALNAFEKAMATDPALNAADNVSTKTQAHLPGFQKSWGEYLISQGKFPDAIQHFKTSIDLTASQDKEQAKETLARAYLKWALTLTETESYYHALERIEDAAESAASENNKKITEDAYASTLTLFAKSKGTQAQQMIADATKSICANSKPLDTLPIIGVLDEKRMTLSGLSFSLPNNVLSQTPGNLHFVACAEEKEVTIQNCPFSRTGYGTVTHWIKRIRYDWQVKIYRSQTGKLVNQRTFQGSAPSYCPRTYSFGSSNTAYFHGGKPATSAVTDWFATLLK
jgi:tetratricopeptide (TPR) repeat protein